MGNHLVLQLWLKKPTRSFFWTWRFSYGSGRTYLLLLHCGKHRISSDLASSCAGLFPLNCYRRLSTTHIENVNDRDTITNPFHPHYGMKFDIISKHNCWGESRVYFYDPKGNMTSVTAHWTSAVLPDHFVMQSAGHSIFHYDDLTEMRSLLKEAAKIISTEQGD